MNKIEIDSSQEPPRRDQCSQHFDIGFVRPLSREASQAHLDFWPTEL